MINVFITMCFYQTSVSQSNTFDFVHGFIIHQQVFVFVIGLEAPGSISHSFFSFSLAFPIDAVNAPEKTCMSLSELCGASSLAAALALCEFLHGT